MNSNQLFVVLLIFVSSSIFAQQEYSVPDERSIDSPVAIPEDHKAIIESKRVLDEINSNIYFQKLELAKLALLDEKIAIANKGIAVAAAEAKEAGKGRAPSSDPYLAKNQNIAPNGFPNPVPSMSQLANAGVSTQAETVKPKTTKPTGLVLLAISDGSVTAAINGLIVELVKGSQVMGYELQQVDMNNSIAKIKLISSGASKNYPLTNSASKSVRYIRPLNTSK